MRLTPALAALALTLSACGGDQQASAPAALPVETVTVQYESLPNLVDLPGRIQPVRSAEVRARVTGIVQRRLYQEGSNVSADQALFQIDPAELRASYAQTDASLARARATAANARAVVDRYRPLVEENAISRQEYDAAVAAMREAEANVAQIEAQLRASSLQLGYTTVRAPISGRVGRAQVTEGALVSQTEGTLLTRIDQMSPIYVIFSQSASEVLRLRRAMDAGDIELPAGEPVEVRLLLADGTEYPVPGVLDFLDQSVEPTTGTVELRAEFANPDNLLLPGEFVRARVTAGRIAQGISVPQSAVTLGENGGSVYVIDGEGKAAVRPVMLGQMVQGKWIVESGLTPGDVVITNNLQKLRPGMAVQATRAQPAAKAKPAARTQER